MKNMKKKIIFGNKETKQFLSQAYIPFGSHNEFFSRTSVSNRQNLQVLAVPQRNDQNCP